LGTEKEKYMKKSFYFKTDKSLGLAEDIETKEPAEAFIKVKMPIDTASPESNEAVKIFIANQLNINPELVYIISKEEYKEDSDDED
jgi:hypothetical protein